MPGGLPLGSGRRKLWRRLLALQLVLMVVTLAVGFTLSYRLLQSDLGDQYERQALVDARVAANDRAIQSAMAAGDPNGSVAAIAARLRAATQASYIVVLDRRGIRHSHPDASLIGQPVSEPLVALDGREHTTVDHGSLGPSANAKVPLRSETGAIIGEVSAGLPEHLVSAAVTRSLPTLVIAAAIALAAGASGSLLLARRLKKQTFGLELAEIASLLQEREAMLHGIREGVVTIDPEGRISLINEEARRLLGVADVAVGEPVRDVVAPGPIQDILSGPAAEMGERTVLTSDYALEMTRMPVIHGGRPLGTVVTARDRTETIGLLRELDSIRSLTDALRGQQHEHANRMHVIAGLLGLARYDEAVSYLEEVAHVAANRAEMVLERVGQPVVTALLIAKTTIATERGVTLRVHVEAPPGQEVVVHPAVDSRTLVTVIGNLVDNAIDATAGRTDGAVTVLLAATKGELRIVVADSGPGVSAPDAVFTDGYTTKATTGISRRGLGLALVRGLVQRAGGAIAVHNEGGAVFTVVLPVPERARADA